MTEDTKPAGGTSLVSDVTKVAETSVMKDLFGRSAKAVGDYYGENVENFFIERREQRRKNIRDHQHKVSEITGEPVDILAEPKRGAAIERWAVAAADVPLEDSERAAILEAVLVQILSSDYSSDFQDVAERLSSSGIRILLNAPGGRKILPESDERINFENLRELGLARKSDLTHFLFSFTGWCVGTSVGLYALTIVVPKILPTMLRVGFIIEGAIISGMIFAAGMALLYTNYTLTKFGRSLQLSALRFNPKKTRIREFRMARLVPGGFLAWTIIAAVLACSIPLLLGRYFPGFETIRTVALSAPPQIPTMVPSALPSPAAPHPPQEAEALKSEDVATLIDVWRSVSEQMNSTIQNTNQIDALISTWPERVIEDRAGVVKQLNALRNTIERVRVSVLTLANAYERYPNIRAVLGESTSQDIFNRLYRALDSFSNEINSLPSGSSENFERTLRPYAGEVKLASTALARWAGDARSFSEAQISQLNNAR